MVTRLTITDGYLVLSRIRVSKSSGRGEKGGGAGRKFFLQHQPAPYQLYIACVAGNEDLAHAECDFSQYIYKRFFNFLASFENTLLKTKTSKRKKSSENHS